jgi:hypothetical protein
MSRERTDNERKLFKRLIISQGDLDHAGWFADFILQRNLHASSDEESRYLHRGLNLALIVAYCRPFSGNTASDDTIGDLPGSYIREFSSEERALHAQILTLRNRDHAHSDPRGHEVQVSIDELLGDPVASAVSRNAYVPLPREDTQRLRMMIAKLLGRVVEEHVRIQQSFQPGDSF